MIPPNMLTIYTPYTEFTAYNVDIKLYYIMQCVYNMDIL